MSGSEQGRNESIILWDTYRIEITYAKEKTCNHLALCYNHYCNFLMTHTGVIIGFDQAIYDVDEDAGQAFVVVEVLNGILRRPVEVTVNTADDSALGEYR